MCRFEACAGHENMLTPKEKERIIKKYKLREKDTGSADVQVALLTEDIKKVLAHLKKHPKDIHSRKGLLRMVIKRKKLLKYLKKENTRRYNSTIKKLGLKRK